MKRPARTPSQLSESIHKRLNAYCLAAGAAGVSVLALAQSVEGRIVYTKVHHIIKPESLYDLDLNNDGMIDFVLSNFTHGNTTGYLRVVTPSSGFLGNCIWDASRQPYASALRAGARVGASPKHFGRCDSGGMATWWNTYSGQKGFRGTWANVKDRYLGLRINSNAGPKYGWARLSVITRLGFIEATLTGYAYETIPNKPIIAGKTHGKDEATLGHLATGASAIPAWRVKPTAATTH
jgi:hypothetical protein